MPAGLSSEYYLYVAKAGEEPKWPRPEEELIIGSQKIGSGFVQYWAYPGESGRSAEDLPPAETAASKNPTHEPAILIDQPRPSVYGTETDNEGTLILILAKNGHAWAKTESSVANLEDNLTSILEFSRDKFNMNVEHFMTTENVNPEVEKKLDDIERAGEVGEKARESAEEEPRQQFHPVNTHPAGPGSIGAGGSYASGFYSPNSSGRVSSSSKVTTVMMLLILGGIVAGGIVFRHKILSKLGLSSSAPAVETTLSPTPAPTSVPTPTLVPVDRSQYKVRVLNGTLRTGGAADLSNALKDKGWKILSIGNATDSAVPQTLVRVKPDLQNVAAALIADLAPDLSATLSANLSATDRADAEVTIGKK